MKRRLDWRRLRPTSVRLKLTLWNVGVLAVILLAFGAALRFRLQANMAAAVDRNLIARARTAQTVFDQPAHGPDHEGPPPFDLGPGGPSDHDERGPRHHDHRAPPLMEDTLTHTPGPFEPLRRQIVDLRGRGLPPFFRDYPWDPDTVAPSGQGREVYSTIHLSGDPVRVLSAPLRRDGHIVGVVQMAASTAEIDREVSRLTTVLLTFMPFALLVAGGAGALLTKSTLRPVRQITQSAGRIEAEDLGARLPVTGGDEFAELAGTFNGMLGRLDDAFGRLRRANQDLTLAFEQQRRFTADASHELRTPLTIIKANASLALLEPRTPAEYQKALEAVDRAADRTTRIVQDLLLLARSDAGRLVLKPVPVCLRDVLTQAVDAAGCAENPTVYLKDATLDLCVLGDADSLVRLFSNLLTNAARHTPPGGQITLSAETYGEQVIVRVADTGVGIAPEHLPHVRDRFYRVDSARSGAEGGTGLGLSICDSIVQAHGGSLSIESAVGHGTTVSVTLPRGSGQQGAAPEVFAREAA